MVHPPWPNTSKKEVSLAEAERKHTLGGTWFREPLVINLALALLFPDLDQEIESALQGGPSVPGFYAAVSAAVVAAADTNEGSVSNLGDYPY